MEEYKKKNAQALEKERLDILSTPVTPGAKPEEEVTETEEIEEVLADKDSDVEFESLDSQEEEKKENSNDFSNDDEDDEIGEGEYGYGWGYNDAFDKPDEEEELDEMDEDERYAAGLDKDDTEKSEV